MLVNKKLYLLFIRAGTLAGHPRSGGRRQWQREAGQAVDADSHVLLLLEVGAQGRVVLTGETPTVQIPIPLVRHQLLPYDHHSRVGGDQKAERMVPPSTRMVVPLM